MLHQTNNSTTKYKQDFVVYKKEIKLYFYSLSREKGKSSTLSVVYHKYSKKSIGDTAKMKKLSMTEFKKTCELLSPDKFIFASENQKWNNAGTTIKANLFFNNMIMAYNPNSICFKGDGGSLQLDRVKSINMSEEDSLLGTVFTVICGDCFSDSHNTFYTIIAQ